MPQNFGSHVTLATLPFLQILRDHVRTDAENTCVKFEVHSFKCFEADGPVRCMHKDTQSYENSSFTWWT